MTQFLRDQASDNEEVVTPIMLDGTYLSRNLATFGPLTFPAAVCNIRWNGSERPGIKVNVRSPKVGVQIPSGKFHARSVMTSSCYVLCLVMKGGILKASADHKLLSPLVADAWIPPFDQTGQNIA